MKTALLGASTALLAAGCLHTHSPRNAPGHVDLDHRPRSTTERPHRPPADPGEQLLTASVGPTGGATIPGTSAPGGDDRTRGTFGGEVSLFHGRNTHSHSHDSETGTRGLLTPAWYVGLNAGLLAANKVGGWAPRTYAEFQYSHYHGLLGAAAGWQAGFDGKHGPQITFILGPLYARTSTSLGLGTDIEFGAFFKIPIHTWVSSL